MKRILIVAILAICIIALGTPCQASSSGSITVIGLSVTNDKVVVFASAYSGGGNPTECLATDWWWPTGTQYVFWFAKTGNDQVYTQFLTAFLEGKPVWVHGTVYDLFSGFGSGVPCRIDPTYGTTMGNY